MEDALPGFGPDVADNAVTLEPRLLCYAAEGAKEGCQQVAIGLRQVGGRGQMPAR